MKRYACALLLHPYKNSIVPRSELREATTLLIETLLSLYHQFPQMRLNLVIPGYILECADPLLSVRLRDLCKKTLLEMIATGYTEPFLSLSPPALSVSNIRHGIKIFEELTGQTPRGFLPPYSNWEPSFIEHLRACGFQFTLLSKESLSPHTRSVPGYWISEHAGSSIRLIGTNIIDQITLNDQFISTIASHFTHTPPSFENPFAIFHFHMPLYPNQFKKACEAVEAMAREIDKNLLRYQPVCLSDFLNTLQPVGMEYIPASLQFERTGLVNHHFMNYLFSFDQIGMIQRKTLDIFNRLTPRLPAKNSIALQRSLFWVQDINRLLPGSDAGFEIVADRSATYKHLIHIDARLRQLNKKQGVRTRISDFLHNGGKTIIVSNKNFKLFIDPQCGGQITGIDFRPRGTNLCGIYNPSRRTFPDIIVSGSSRTWFFDRILEYSKYRVLTHDHLFHDTSDFQHEPVNYKVRKSGASTTISLIHAGSFLCDKKQQPLSIEKVFGLEEELPELSFVYEFTNPSLIAYSFIFATELNMFLPGIATNEVTFYTGRKKHTLDDVSAAPLDNLTNWHIDDRHTGIRISFQTQKPLSLWHLPPTPESTPQGVSCMLTSAIAMEPSSRYKIVGKIFCKQISSNQELDDVL